MSEQKLKIYAFSGLGADARVFEALEVELIVLDWVPPQKNERIESYATRMAALIPSAEPCILLGVSFGGVVAVEVAKIIQPIHLVLISSIETDGEIRNLFKFVGKLNLMKLVPITLLKYTQCLIYPFFEAQNKTLLKLIIKDTDWKFARWAIQVLCLWKNKTMYPHTIRIHGDTDRLFPIKNQNVYLLKGGHFVVVDQAQKIDEILKKVI